MLARPSSRAETVLVLFRETTPMFFAVDMGCEWCDERMEFTCCCWSKTVCSSGWCVRLVPVDVNDGGGEGDFCSAGGTLPPPRTMEIHPVRSSNLDGRGDLRPQPRLLLSPQHDTSSTACCHATSRTATWKQEAKQPIILIECWLVGRQVGCDTTQNFAYFFYAE